MKLLAFGGIVALGSKPRYVKITGWIGGIHFRRPAKEVSDMANATAFVTRVVNDMRSDHTRHSRVLLLFVVTSLLWPCVRLLPAQAQERTASQAPPTPKDVKPGSITLEDVPYPYPVSYLPMTLYGQDVRMAYMDVPAESEANGRTVVLLHGMNFFGEYWSGTIDVLRKQGFRVVVPDQIGFGRSSKPIIPYNFHDMALNTRKLLQHLGISKAAIVGHSMGGMLAARFAASYPDLAERAVIYNPIGLTDPRWVRPWRSTDESYKDTLDWTYQRIYQGIARYFVQGWRPEYEKYVRIHYAWTLSGDWPRFAMVRTLVQQMVYLDPVVYDWPHIKVKTLVLGGDKDGANFPERAKHIADTIPGAELVLIPNVGHVPHFEAPDLFYKALLKFLNSDAVTPVQKHAANRSFSLKRSHTLNLNARVSD